MHAHAHLHGLWSYLSSKDVAVARELSDSEVHVFWLRLITRVPRQSKEGNGDPTRPAGNWCLLPAYWAFRALLGCYWV